MRAFILSVALVFVLGLSAMRVGAEPSKGDTAKAAYTCNAKECTCVGDDNCNKMFSGGACTGGVLSTNCDTSGKNPVCTCVNAARAPQTKTPNASVNTNVRQMQGNPPGATGGTAAKPGSQVGGVRAPASGVIATQLTKSECTQLGGFVNTASKACTDKGYFTCKTIDSKGVVHTACINNR